MCTVTVLVKIVSLYTNHWYPSTWASDLSTIVIAWLQSPQWSGFASKARFLSQLITLDDEACLKSVKYRRSMLTFSSMEDLKR